MRGKPKQLREEIIPEALYPIARFIEVSGISQTRIREARKQHGVVCPAFKVGRRTFIEGEKGISYIKQLSTLPRVES